jgi:hypothetical protein
MQIDLICMRRLMALGQRLAAQNGGSRSYPGEDLGHVR